MRNLTNILNQNTVLTSNTSLLNSRELRICLLQLYFRSFGDSRACLGPAERAEVPSAQEKNSFEERSTQIYGHRDEFGDGGIG